ncbi:MAG TPA: septum site-determining protein Ssd, partial [Pseudonocardiaceae bacterium]|nr:septum site-determining protein Ssd [Pseudonocardiaceae bacterium]
MAPGALADEVLRIAAAAGCEPAWIADPLADRAALREQWNTAPLLLLDVQAATSAAGAALSRRDRVVVVVVAAGSDSEIWRRAVAVGAEHVAVLPEAEAWLVGALADAVEAPAEPGRVLAVVGGRGGAGASVLAAAVAVTAGTAGHRALLVDCDVLGGGLDLAVGAERTGGLRWP